MKQGKCVYCGEFEGQKFIPDPNSEGIGDGKDWWVCITCEKIIMEQMGLSFGHILKDSAEKHGLSKKLIGDIEKSIKQHEKNIDDISHESGVETVTFTITKKKREFE